MPRPYLGPRLWLDKRRSTWTIADRGTLIRTGCAEADKDAAMEMLRQYAGKNPIAPPSPPRTWRKYRNRRVRQYGVYVVGYGEYVKIGISRDVVARVAALQVGAPEEIRIIAVLDGWEAEERALHIRFEQYRLKGEWFRKTGDLADWIEGGCQPDTQGSLDVLELVQA